MVAVRGPDADRTLAAPPPGIRLFLIYGSDAGAVSERARLTERVALTRGGGDGVIRLGSDELAADPGRIVDEASSASLFGGEPVITLRVLDGRHNVAGAVAPLFDRPPEAAWLIVEAGELAPSSALRKAFETARHAVAVPTYPLEGGDLSAMIRAAADEAGMSIDPAAEDLLVENLGGDRLAIRGELEKLFLYLRGQRTVTYDAVLAIVGDTTSARADHAIDASLLGDNEALELALGRLRAEGASPSALGALALRHLIQLQSLRVSFEAGSDARRAVDFARPPIFGRRKAVVQAEVERWPVDAIAGARGALDRTVMLMRLQPALEDAAMSAALHGIALTARRLKRGRASSA